MKHTLIHILGQLYTRFRSLMVFFRSKKNNSASEKQACNSALLYCCRLRPFPVVIWKQLSILCISCGKTKYRTAK